MILDDRQADAAIAATWPGRSERRVGPWIIRQGDAGGRSRAAYLAERYAPGCVETAEAAIAEQGDEPLIRVRPWDDGLEQDLTARGYAELDPTLALAICPDDMPPPEAMAIEVWPPLALLEGLWADGGIGPARIANMVRFDGPKTAILVRDGQRPAALGFVNQWQGIAVGHAIHTLPDYRRRGLARHLMLAMGRWARSRQATALMVPVAAANAAARALYASIGMTPVGGYRYFSKDGLK